MKRWTFLLLSFLLTGLILMTAGCTQQGATPAQPVATPASTTVQQTSPAPMATPAAEETRISNETLTAFVNSAAAYVKANGQEKALAEFNNRNGSFVRGELYIYAYGLNGTTLAHPIHPESLGKKREGQNGVIVEEMSKIILKDGSVFYRFTYVNPAHNNTVEAKLGYGVKAGDDWWLGSGVYEGPVTEITGTPGAPMASPAPA